MAKTKLSEWSATASSNTDINSINIAEGMAPSDVNNAIREMMAQLKDFQTGADDDNLTVGGNLVVDGTSTFTGAASFSSVPSGVLPPGVTVPFAGTVATVPTGWLFCNGAAVNRTTYAALFAVIGTIYGSGDGSTTFNLPDLRNKFVIGANADDGGAAKTNVTGSYTSTGGTKDAVNVSHTHTATVTDPGHVHSFTRTVQGTLGAQVGVADGGSTLNTNSATTGITVGISTEGSSGTNANLPPYQSIAYIIKT